MTESWISTLKKTFENDPLASNVAFSFLLVLLEKLVDIDFACPCKENNAYFVAAYFLIPAFLTFVVMISRPSAEFSKIKELINGNCILSIENIDCCAICTQCMKCIKNWLKEVFERAKAGNWIIPVIVWIILLLFDGRYVACGNSDWSGRFVTADKVALKWCETDNSTLYEERLKKSQDWYYHSQVRKISFFKLFHNMNYVK